jgi:uncharacterized membrane protein YcjF (UPF0283 family)
MSDASSEKDKNQSDTPKSPGKAHLSKIRYAQASTEQGLTVEGKPGQAHSSETLTDSEQRQPVAPPAAGKETRRGCHLSSMRYSPAEIQRSLSPGEEQEVLRQIQEEEAQAFAKERERHAPRSFQLPGWALQAAFLLATSIVVALVAATATWVIWLSVTIPMLPWPAQWAALILGILIGSGVLFIVLRVIWMFVHFKRSPAPSIKALTALAERMQWRKDLAENHVGKVRTELLNYVAAIPLDTGRHAEQEALQALGFEERDIARLTETREELLAPSREYSHREWVQKYYDDFQKRLDDKASERVKYYMIRVATMTAACPRKSYLDMLIVIYYSSSLVSDIMRIYGVSPGRGAASLIMLRIGFSTFITGSIDSVLDQVDIHFDPHDHVGADGLLAGLGEGLASVITPLAKKGAEVLTNVLLMRRLGNATIRSLQPVSPDTFKALV